MLLSFVIPCYRSEQTLETVVNTIEDTMLQRAEIDYEIVLTNDGSPDNVGHVIANLVKSHPRIIGIDLANNFGQAAATLAALSVASGDYLVMMDDDGQCPVQNIFEMLDKLEQGFDAVIACYNDKYNGFFRKGASALNEMMMQVLINKPANLRLSSFWIFKSFIRDFFCACKVPNMYMAGYLLRVTNKIANVEMRGQERVEGSSTYSLSKLLSLWIMGFIAFSVKPLRISSLIGVIFAILGFVYGSVIVVQKLYNPSIPAGYSSLIAIILLLGGIILCMLGLMGEYIGRSFMCVNDTPQYVIRRVMRNDSCSKSTNKN